MRLASLQSAYQKPSCSGPLYLPRYLVLVVPIFRVLSAFGFALILLALTTCVHAGNKKKQAKPATPAQGNGSDQQLTVNNPFCDAYLPYEFQGGEKKIVQQFPDLKYPLDAQTLQSFLDRTDIDTFLAGFLEKKWSITDPVAKDWSLHDPGYPLLGDPQRHLYSDGTDLSRILIRLFASAKAQD